MDGSASNRPARPRKERGALLAGLMAWIAILSILAGMAAQSWADVLRREKEAEMMFRAQQIVIAIYNFRQDQGRLPLKLDELMEPGQRGQYFLRKLYDDPLMPGGNWGLLYANPQGGVFDPNIAGLEQLGELGTQDISPTGTTPGGINPTQLNQGGPLTAEGLPIVGVKSLATDRPFRVYKDADDYSQWLFHIFDLQAQLQGSSSNAGTNPPQSPPPNPPN